MTRHTFAKILVLVITISILGVGIVPVNANCACCCEQPQSQSQNLHPGSNSKGYDLASGCCSQPKTSPCDLSSDQASHMQECAVSTMSGVERPDTVKLAAVASDTIVSQQPHHHVAFTMRPPIRGPNNPIYLQNLSLLI